MEKDGERGWEDVEKRGDSGKGRREGSRGEDGAAQERRLKEQRSLNDGWRKGLMFERERGGWIHGEVAWREG